MRLTFVFTVNYVYALLFGAGFILFPTFCGSLVGFEMVGDADLIARVLGIFVLATGLLTFFARNTEVSQARRAIVLTLLLLYALLIVYKLFLNWSAGIPVNFVLGFIYLLHVGFVVAYGLVLLGPESLEGRGTWVR